MPLVIYAKDQYRLFQQLEKLDKAAHDMAALQIAQSVAKIANDARARAPKSSGALGELIFGEILKGGLTGVISALPAYALAVEFGYKGIGGRGNRSHKFPVRKVGGRWEVVPEIVAWAKAHGLNPWAVARKIHLKGFAPQPFLIPALESERKPFLDGIRKAIGEEAPKSIGATTVLV